MATVDDGIVAHFSLNDFGKQITLEFSQLRRRQRPESLGPSIRWLRISANLTFEFLFDTWIDSYTADACGSFFFCRKLKPTRYSFCLAIWANIRYICLDCFFLLCLFSVVSLP